MEEEMVEVRKRSKNSKLKSVIHKECRTYIPKYTDKTNAKKDSSSASVEP
jgi:hypothetical protein